MNKLGEFKGWYVILVIFVFVICIIGSTYAYLTTSATGGNDVGTTSSNYNISMRITPIYNNFSMIPMDDTDVLKAINNECKDKYDRGSCNLYSIKVYDFNSNINAISGSMNVHTDDILNLSFMVFEETDDVEEGKCVTIDESNYCISEKVSNEVNHIEPYTNMSIGDDYDVLGLEEKNLLLVFWLTNLDEVQNDIDIGSYDATVTISLGGDGGQISGNINGMLNNNENILQSEE